MRKTLLSLAMASTMLMADAVAPVEDAKDFYVGVSTAVGVSDSTSIDWFGLTTVGAQAGYTAIKVGNFETSVEGRYTTDATDWFDTYTYGVFVKPGYDLGGVTAYGLVGYQDGSSNDVLDFDGELAYGAGATTDILGYDVFADYVYGNDTDSEIVTVGINYRF